MSRTFKDKKPQYLGADEVMYRTKNLMPKKRRYLNYEKSGPPLDSETCPDCGGFADFVGGYFCCNSCGWTEIAMQDVLFGPRSLAHKECA